MMRTIAVVVLLALAIGNAGCRLPLNPVNHTPPVVTPNMPEPGKFQLQSVGDYEIAWLRQFGTESHESVTSCVANADGVFIGGWTMSALPGMTFAGFVDAYLRKYDSLGNIVWTRQFGGESLDQISDVAVDSTGVYVVGSTFILPSPPGGFLQKYSHDGDLLWSRELVGPGVNPMGIVVNSQGIYVTGTAPGPSEFSDTDIFFRKYDLSGTEEWRKQFGSFSNENSPSIDVDMSGITLVGFTEGDLPGKSNAGILDAFVFRYDLNGNLIWFDQFGTSGVDHATAVLTNGSHIYIGGTTSGLLPGIPPNEESPLDGDYFIRKYSHNGAVIWTRQEVSPGGARIDSIAAKDNRIFAGGSFGSAAGFVSEFDSDGGLVWQKQIGEFSNIMMLNSISVEGDNIYGGGHTQHPMAGQTSAGGQDAYTFKLSLVTNELPHVTCPPNLIVEATSSSGTAVVLADIAATDPDGGDIAVTTNPPSGSIFALGTSIVLVSATDDEESIATCSFRVTVQDTTAPEISCPPDQTFTTTDPTGTSLQLPIATASDAVDPSPTIQFVGAPTTFPWGTTMVTSQATDDFGNSSTCQFNVTVELLTAIDVMPGTSLNRVNRSSSGTLPVAILSSSVFDATQIDPATVNLAGASVSSKPKGKLQAVKQDVNKDGRLDWMLQFDYKDLQISTAATQLVLRGKTFAGKPVKGMDSIQIVK